MLPIWANCSSISGRHSTLAPESISIKGPLSPGISAAKAARDTPLIRLTRKVAPIIRAPVLPALTKASPSPAARRRSPSAIEQFFFSLRMLLGSSSIPMTSGASKMAIPSREMPFSCATRRISSSRPTRATSTLYSSWASAAPLITSSGALSPPNASTITRMAQPSFLSFVLLAAKITGRAGEACPAKGTASRPLLPSGPRRPGGPGSIPPPGMQEPSGQQSILLYYQGMKLFSSHIAPFRTPRSKPSLLSARGVLIFSTAERAFGRTHPRRPGAPVRRGYRPAFWRPRNWNIPENFIVLERWRNSAGVLVEHGLRHNISQSAARCRMKNFWEA